jgi:hypothetical protein
MRFPHEGLKWKARKLPRTEIATFRENAGTRNDGSAYLQRKARPLAHRLGACPNFIHNTLITLVQ